jgi:ribosomal protein S18 acetylase RimI-like enzyme
VKFLEVKIRKATPEDAKSISHIWEVLCAERIYTAVSKPFTVKQESEYISSLSEREGIFVAELNNKIIGFLSLDLWSKIIDSFKHVCTIGTFILPEWRGKKISYKLADFTFDFAKANKFDKIVIYVRKGNERAIKFYQNLGFLIKGELERQVLIDNIYENEVFMEKFLQKKIFF